MPHVAAQGDWKQSERTTSRREGAAGQRVLQANVFAVFERNNRG